MVRERRTALPPRASFLAATWSLLSSPAFQSQGHPGVDRGTPHLADSHTSFSLQLPSGPPPPPPIPTNACALLFKVCRLPGWASQEGGAGAVSRLGGQWGLTVGCTP